MGKPVDMTGRKHGKWTLGPVLRADKKKNRIWKAVCECGNEGEVVAYQLLEGYNLSCWSCNPRNLTGQTINGIKVLEQVGESNQKHKGLCWKCECERCHKVFATNTEGVKNGAKVCACNRINYTRPRTTGVCSKSREYAAWTKAISRCINLNDKQYNDYGGRGIKVCKGILNSVKHFVQIVGMKPEPKNKYSLDRIDNNLGYYCGECDDCKENSYPLNLRWVTKDIQANNTRACVYIEYKGETKTMAQWAKSLGMTPMAFGRRLSRGWTIEQAITTPLKKQNKYEYATKTMWKSMKTRCYNPNSELYEDYGGRGILICEGILDSFQKLVDTLGEKPSREHTVDREDCDKGYFCGSCAECIFNDVEKNIKWSSHREQANNRRKKRFRKAKA